MSVIRAFIAFDLSPEIYQRLDAVIADLKMRLPGVAVRWVPALNIHVTLKFLGDVSVANLDVLKKILRREAANHHSFEISVGELGAFPSIHRPRVIWVGVKAPPELAAIQRSIENETTSLGYSPDDRPFSPHLTIGRVARSAGPDDAHRIGEVLAASKVGFLGVTWVQVVNLYRSDLQTGGAQYSQLSTAPLGPAPSSVLRT
jgi:RNA 2',3'-cyclic 3'-phosphodiesterase